MVEIPQPSSAEVEAAVPFSSPVYFVDRTPQVVSKSVSSVASLRAATYEEKDKAREMDAEEDYFKLYVATARDGQEDELRKRLFRFQYGDDVMLPGAINTEEWANLDNYYHPNGATLLSCIREFRDLRPKAADHRSEIGKCGIADGQFLALLKKRGLVTTTINETDGLKNWYGIKEAKVDTINFGDPRAEGGCPHHQALRLGNIVVDWTYRQYDPEAPYPYVYRLKPGEQLRAKKPVAHYAR